MKWDNLLMKAVLFGLAFPVINMLPHSYSFRTRALVVGVVVSIINWYLYKTYIEGFDNPDTRVDQPCPPGYTKCKSGDCKLKTDIYMPCVE